MSSHREAPEISKAPVADGTDVYAFVSPDRPTHVTLIANFIPLQKPDSGPNFYEFGDDVLYEIHVNNRGDATKDVTYQFKFSTKVRNDKTFLYNTGPITGIGSPNWNRPQFYSLRRIERRKNGDIKKIVDLGTNLRVPPVNVGKRSTPNYANVSSQAIHEVKQNTRVFCGQRADAFHVDLGSIFDLGALRPLNEAHLISMPNAAGVNGVQGYNVHTIAIEVPIRKLTRDGTHPTNALSKKAVIGVWATASRRKSQVWNKDQGKYVGHGPWEQVSRLANPLFNEVIVPMAEKDEWNARGPHGDKRYTKYVNKPELQGLLPVLYPGAFSNLAAYDKPRADLNAVLMTGIPAGVVPGFQNFTGAVQADMLRLNVAVPPSSSPNDLGLVAGDAAGWPNGRRVNDDVVTVALRAVAGLTIPLVDPSYTPDGAASAVADGTTNTNTAATGPFPSLGPPGGGYQTEPGPTSAS
jgi:hypothetical protein